MSDFGRFWKLLGMFAVLSVGALTGCCVRALSYVRSRLIIVCCLLFLWRCWFVIVKAIYFELLLVG